MPWSVRRSHLFGAVCMASLKAESPNVGAESLCQRDAIASNGTVEFTMGSPRLDVFACFVGTSHEPPFV